MFLVGGMAVGGICEELMDIILENEDEPRVTVRMVLEALREPRPEVVAVGIEPARWRAALGALLVSVDQADAAEVEERRQSWIGMRRELEELGCRLWQLGEDENRWRIEGLGVDAEVDLLSGDIEGLDYGPNVRFEDLVGDVDRMMRSKRRDLAEKARRAALRETHHWDGKLKGWVPKNGDGPIIRGGGRV